MDFRRLLTVAILATALILVYYNNHSFTNEVLITTTTIHQALAQVPPVPTSPEIDDETIAGIQPPTTDSSQSQLPQSATSPNTSIPPTPTIQITSHQDGSQVPVGELTLQGTSSDNQESNCQVYADVNDISPLQNATAAGTNGDNDYSQWTFTYTQDYQLIVQGVNELTAKISCLDNVTAAPLSEWHSVNVTGVGGGAITPAPAPAQTTPSPSPVPPPTMAQAPTGNALGLDQEAASIPSTSTSPSVPFAAPEEPAASSQGLGGGPVVQGGVGVDNDDDDGGEDDDGDDNGDEDGDDDGGEDDDGSEGDDG
jgi:hypothetical protein